MDTAKEVAQNLMPSDCSDTHFWAPDRHSELHYWLKPFTCDSSATTFVVKLPGDKSNNGNNNNNNNNEKVEISMSFGGGHRQVPKLTAAAMDGTAVFGFADGYDTVANGPAPAGTDRVTYLTLSVSGFAAKRT